MTVSEATEFRPPVWGKAIPELREMGIYSIRCIPANRVYVGRAGASFWRRWHHHRSALRRGKHCNSKLQRAWDKYGEEAFVFNVLEVVADRSLLREREDFWAGQLSAFDVESGFNAKSIEEPRSGPMSNEGRQKISEAHKKSGHKPSASALLASIQTNRGRKRSAEELEKQASHLRGRKRPKEVVEKIAAANRGKTKSPEHRAKLSAARQGVSTITEDGRRRLSEARTGHVWSEDTREAIASKHLGTTHTDAAKAKMRQAKLGKKKTPTEMASIAAAKAKTAAMKQELSPLFNEALQRGIIQLQGEEMSAFGYSALPSRFLGLMARKPLLLKKIQQALQELRGAVLAAGEGE